MAVVVSLNCHIVTVPPPVFVNIARSQNRSTFSPPQRRRPRLAVANARNGGSDCDPNTAKGEVDNLGVRVALSVLKFYKREISPVLPKSCRYVPTCSEYGMEAYKKYGFNKGTVLTVWRICRCNPLDEALNCMQFPCDENLPPFLLGGSGFDPPRWFGETSLPED